MKKVCLTLSLVSLMFMTPSCGSNASVTGTQDELAATTQTSRSDVTNTSTSSVTSLDSADSSASNPAPSSSSVVGHYTAPKHANFISDFTADGKFHVVQGQLDVTGTYMITGNVLTLIPDKKFGLPPASGIIEGNIIHDPDGFDWVRQSGNNGPSI